MPLLVDRRVARGRLAQGYQKARRTRRRDSTLRPLSAPLNPDELRVERAITTGIKDARARVRSERLLEAIRMRSADEIIASVPVEPIRGIMRPIDTVFRDRMVWAATKQGEEFNVRRAFSVVDPEVIRYAGLQAGELINRMTTEQFAALRGAIVDAVAGQFTVDDTAKIIRSSIGLTDRYRKAVEKRYVTVKQTLMSGGQTERAAADAAERMAAKYADKLVRSRARTIARTEINTAQNYGKQIGWEAAYGEGMMSPDTLKEWQISSGACDICRPYSGIRVPVMQPFPTGDLMPPAHPNCRCTANIVSPVRDIIQRLEDEDRAAEPQPVEPTVAPTQANIDPRDPQWLDQNLNSIVDEAQKLRQSWERSNPNNQSHPEALVISRRLGLDDKPQVVSRQQMDELIKNNPERQMYRGVKSAPNKTAESMFDDFKGGEMFIGSGVRGDGIYFAARGSEATATPTDAARGGKYITNFGKLTAVERYAGANGVVMRATIDPESISIDIVGLQKEIFSARQNYSQHIFEQNTAISQRTDIDDATKRKLIQENDQKFINFDRVTADPANWARLRGIDVIETDVFGDTVQDHYWVILNRKKVIVQDEADWNAGEWKR